MRTGQWTLQRRYRCVVPQCGHIDKAAHAVTPGTARRRPVMISITQSSKTGIIAGQGRCLD
jgi:hypothetical protein